MALPDRSAFYVPSLSSRTLIYKGMLKADQIAPMFPDLADPDVESALALVHQRFSTNTFPSWPLAHPYRFVAHNGEINTLRGNINWMQAREALLESDVLGDDLKKILPIIREGGSDTAIFDNVLEFLVMAGRSLPHAVLMMIPEPWQNHEGMSPELKAFYEYHSSLMEPWDGPASIAFTDGTVIGAVLDRNGLRPSRYYVTTDDLVIMASEVGVLDIPAEKIVIKERLHPGRILLIDTAKGRIIADEEIKTELANEHPYREWLQREHDADRGRAGRAVPAAARPRDRPPAPARVRLHAGRPEDRAGTHGFGRRRADRIDGHGHAAGGAERAAAAALRLLHAAVRAGHQPAARCDPRGARHVDGVDDRAGGQPPEARPGILPADQHHVPDHRQRSAGQAPAHRPAGFSPVTLPMLYRPEEEGLGLEYALDNLQDQASQAVKDGATILILSDRGVTREFAPIPSLLATAGVHHHLVREGARTRCALVIESGDAREVHHVALLIGYGAGAVNPYLAFETLDDMIRQHALNGITHEKAVSNYVKGLNKGILKVMSKMGISTLQSYCGAQIFEAVGLDQAFVDRHFTSTASRIGGAGLEVVAQEVRHRHERAFPARVGSTADLDNGGDYQWRRDGEMHLFNPQTVQKLQHATRTGQYAHLSRVHEARERPEPQARHAARPARFRSGWAAGADRRGRAGRSHREAVRDRRDVVRLDQPGSARDDCHCDEPAGRKIEYG